ncbi:MAG: hypothetical protein Q9187_000401 [Circinaria calcarea]
MHLEGSLSPDLLFSLARQNEVSLPSPAEDPSFASPSHLLDRYARFTSLDDFLHYYFIGMSVLLTVEDFEALAWEYFCRANKDGVVHAEVSFDPQAHTGRGVAYKTVVEGFVRACRRAEKAFGMSTLLILCFLRHLPVPEAASTFEAAKGDLLDGTLAGIGLDSSEKGFPPELFKTVYQTARETGIRRTAHAGEEGDAESVKGAIEHLDVMRIDHGIRIADDEGLIDEVARKGYLVTMCPLSNVRLQCVKSVKDLPIRTFLDRGINFSVNSDDPAYFGGYILDNYCAVQETFGLSMKEWERIATAAVNGSWCDDNRKGALMHALEGVIKKYSSD